jgi:ribosomal protein L23
MDIHPVIRRPLVTEKSNIGREEQNLATFAVNPNAT